MIETYLEFGEKDGKRYKKIYDLKMDFQAYEWFMTSRYFSDILCYRNMLKQIENKVDFKLIYDNYLKKIHKTSDINYNFKKLLALEVINGESFLELGSSLFGCIEGMLVCKKLIDKYTDIQTKIQLENIDWYGIDISDFMNELAKISYPKYKLHLMNSLDGINTKTDVFFAKGISLLYAIRKPEEFKKIVNNNTICLFDYSFALKKRQVTTVGSGLEVEYLTLKECLPVLKNGNKEIYVNLVNHDFSGKDRRFFDMVIAEKPIIDKFVKLSEQAYDNEYFDMEMRWIPLSDVM